MNAGLVALLWGPSGLPRDADERGVLAAELMQKGIEFGISGEDVWMDPIVTPVTSPQSQVQVPSCIEFMKMFKDLQEILPWDEINLWSFQCLQWGPRTFETHPQSDLYDDA